jgi:oxygen-independent coproporphyrinogen-3 oxidase
VPGVYISYPFCAQKCTYCNFASGVLPREVEDAYTEALLAEIASAKWTWTPETVYLGGGTPSQMPLERLQRILDAVPGRPWREATLEAAPGTITSERARRWGEMGINRVSLGVQSFVARELARTGRKHTAEIVEREFGLLRDAGLSNVNVDLIAGLPGQTETTWAESFAWIEKLAPPHVSVYMLEVDEDSRLGREMLLGGIRYGAGDAPSEDMTALFYETAASRLAALGISRYEISNFARLGSESLHNLKYWKRAPYVGFGADAHSFDGSLRWQNVESAVEYVKRSPQVRAASTSSNQDEERFFVGLRLAEGIETVERDWTDHGTVLNRLLAHGFISRSGSKIRLTDRGVMVSNEIFQEFLRT